MAYRRYYNVTRILRIFNTWPAAATERWPGDFQLYEAGAAGEPLTGMAMGNRRAASLRERRGGRDIETSRAAMSTIR
jgi:hypothetical protein